MEIIHVIGNTYYLQGWQIIPFYRVDETHCILLDTGTVFQRREIEDALAQAHLVPIGILGTHIHTDHSANHRYFQEKYGIPIALPAGEAGLCLTPLHLKSYFHTMSLQQIIYDEETSVMPVVADQIIDQNETEITFCGARFRILHTPGHSPGHISIYTPDNVLYLGDALLTGGDLTEAKLPYFFAIQQSITTMETLRNVKADIFLAAHRGQYTEIGTIIDNNIVQLNNKAEEIRQIVTHPMTAGRIYAAVCQYFGLHATKPRTAALLERNMQCFLEYLVDTNRLTVTVCNCMRYYEQP